MSTCGTCHQTVKTTVSVIGPIWWPVGAICAQDIDLRDYDAENIGEITRENVENWLGMNAGDFQYVTDFSVRGKGIDIPWESEESVLTYSDCMFGEYEEEE